MWYGVPMAARDPPPPCQVLHRMRYYGGQPCTTWQLPAIRSRLAPSLGAHGRYALSEIGWEIALVISGT